MEDDVQPHLPLSPHWRMEVARCFQAVLGGETGSAPGAEEGVEPDSKQEQRGSTVLDQSLNVGF